METAIASEEFTLVEKAHAILKVLSDHNVSYKKKAHPDMVMVHPTYRCGLGINAFNAHRNMRNIKQVGGDLNKLLKSVATEISTEPEKQAVQIEFNEKLIKQSAELLAQLTGRERLMSLSSGHTVAGCRACIHGCRTSEEELKLNKSSGRLDAAALSAKDSALREMFYVGWEWTVIPAKVEDMFTMLPDIVQMAYSLTVVQELEVGETLVLQ